LHKNKLDVNLGKIVFCVAETVLPKGQASNNSGRQFLQTQTVRFTSRRLGAVFGEKPERYSQFIFLTRLFQSEVFRAFYFEILQILPEILSLKIFTKVRKAENEQKISSQRRTDLTLNFLEIKI